MTNQSLTHILTDLETTMQPSADMCDYFTDASRWNIVELTTPSGDEFWRIKSCDLAEFPELASTFGVQLRPTGQLILHASQLEYMAAVAAACV